MRYHESLSAAAEVAVKHNISLDNETIIVRDGSGKLILARESVENVKEVEDDFRKALGGYAAPLAIVTGAAAKRLVSSAKSSIVSVALDNQDVTVRYVDRRVVGMDWLHAPSISETLPKRLVFGSLKGGVGRSTALSILAADLAKAGKRVLAIDLDLEAPGIGFMMLPESEELALDRRPQYGVIDYLLENRIVGVADEELYDFVGVSPFAEGTIDVVPAVGRETDLRPWLMIEKLSRAVVENHADATVTSWADQVKNMVDRLVARQKYDAVLIDARAGMSEITAAPLLALGAEILLFGTDQPQTFRGYSYLLSHLVGVSEISNSNEDFDWRRRISFVQSKAASASSKRENFREELYELCAEYLYDEETLVDGEVVAGDFSPGPNITGIGIPHDSLYVQYHPDYDAFNPVGDVSQLDPDVYKGPFGPFLERAWALLELKKPKSD